MADENGYQGTMRADSGTNEYNAQKFVLESILNRRNHAAPVEIVAVNSPGGLALAGTVDVRILVNQLAGDNSSWPHGVICDIPYIRIQGGANAIIIDPQVGDIGTCLFCDQDISAVQAARGAANPGSDRRNNVADGVYIGGMLNGIPSQFVMFTEDGITIKSPTAILLEAPAITMEADTVTINAGTGCTMTTPKFTLNGDMDATGTIKAPIVNGTTNVIFAGKSSITHTHGGVQTGSGTTGGPT